MSVLVVQLTQPDIDIRYYRKRNDRQLKTEQEKSL